METPARHSFTLDGTTRVFPIPSNLKGDNYVRLEVDGAIINDRSKYDIVNNAIVFNNAADVPSGSQLDVLVVQSEEAIGQLAITSNIDIVASNIDDVNTVGASIAAVNTNAANITVIQTAETNAASALASKNAAAASQAAAATSATNAATSATASATSASNSATSATASAASATTATTQATAAGTSATNASNSATAAATSATNASNSATAASTSASQAASSATSASTSASNAATSATNASNSASSASSSASTATTQAGIATTQASNAASSASSASTSATNALASENNAATSATEASTSASNAATSADEAAASAALAAAVGLPDPTGQGGKFLSTDGTDSFWDVVDTGVATLNGQTGAIVNTNLYAIGSYVTGRTNNGTTNHTVNSLLSGSQLYSVSPNCHYQGGLWGLWLSTSFFNNTAAATLVNVGTWRCVSPAPIINSRGTLGLWVRIS